MSGICLVLEVSVIDTCPTNDMLHIKMYLHYLGSSIGFSLTRLQCSVWSNILSGMCDISIICNRNYNVSK